MITQSRGEAPVDSKTEGQSPAARSLRLRLLLTLVGVCSLFVAPNVRAQLSEGQTAIRTYVIQNLQGRTLGYVVATGEGSGVWGRDREYWFWEGQPFPATTFSLRQTGTAPPAGLDPRNATVYTNDEFPSSPSQCLSLTGGGYRLSRESVAVGSMRNLGPSGLQWQIFASVSGSISKKYPTGSLSPGAEYLRFTPASTLQASATACASVNSPMLSTP